MSLVSTRISEDLDKELKWYAEKEKIEKTVALRKVLNRGMKEIRLEYGLDLYQKGKVTLWKAAEIAELSLWEIIDVVRERKIQMPHTLEDLKEDVKAVLEE